MFQSRLGFSGRLDIKTSAKATATVVVSIPSWVFWSSRQDELPVRVPNFRVSIPSWVFWSSRRFCCCVSDFRYASFNPVLGFLVVSTRRDARPRRTPRSFNPVLGFLVVSTQPTARRCCRRRVSIPSWVFWSSRLSAQLRLKAVRFRFNPVLGFLVVSTLCC